MVNGKRLNHLYNMKNILYILLLFLPILSFCQGVQNDKYYNLATGTNSYTVAINSITASAIYDGQKIAVKFVNANSGASSLVVVSGNGTYAVKDIETTSGGALPSGTIAANSAWYLIYNSSYNSWQLLGSAIPAVLSGAWSITGNAGTVAGTNFIGTTDNVDLIFKMNSIQSGKIGALNTSFGQYALNPLTSGALNTAFGINSLYGNTSGTNNTAVGQAALQANTTGSYNTSIGVGGLVFNTTGSNNTAIGYASLFSQSTASSNVAIGNSAGYYETGSNKLFIDNSARTSEADARIKSMIYGVFGATIATQSLTINGQLRINDGTGVTGYILTYKSDGFSEWAASASSEWTQSGNDIYNNNSGNVGIGSSSPPFSAKLFVNAGSGIVGQEIATVNTVGLSILSGGGGVNINNTSAGSPGLNIYSASGGITGQSVGDGIDWTAPEMVFKSNNSAVLLANNTTVANSFEDNQTLGAFTSTGNFFQIVSNNASTRPQFVINKQGTNDVFVTSTGLFGIGTGTVVPTSRLQATSTGSTSATYAVKINDSASDTLFHIRSDGALYFGSNGTNTTSGDGATIDEPSGSFIKDATGTTFTLTNALITAKSKLICTMAGDLTATGHAISVVEGTGSAVITFWTLGGGATAAAPSGNQEVNFWVVNY